MLSAKNITYSTGGKVLLDNVTATFGPGKLNLVIGPNGAGKSTLVKILCNQIHPDGNGSVHFGNRDIRSFSIAEMAQMRSVLSQNIDLAFPLTVSEIVMMGRYPHFTGKPAEKDRIACYEAMQFFDVSGLSGRNYMTLSGGEKQRVHFARVLSQIWYPVHDKCRYLILDEPLTFLDIHYQFDFMEKLLELLKQTDMVVVGVVHDLNLAARFAGNILLLNNGKVVADGDKHRVLTRENIKTVYRLEPVFHYEQDEMYLFFS